MKRWSILKQLWRPFQDNLISIHAAAACYYLLISFLPASMLFISVFSYLSIPEIIVVDFLHSWIPSPFRKIIFKIWNTLSLHLSPAMLSISAVALLWSASKGISALIEGTRNVMDLPKISGFLRRKITSMLCFVLLAVSVYLIFKFQILWYLAAGVQQSLNSRNLIRIVLSFSTLSFIFSLFYRMIPGKKLPLPACFIGGGFCAAGWILISFLFQVYIGFSSEQTQLYGAIGIFLSAALWLLLCVKSILYGCLLAVLYSSGSYHPIQIIKNAICGNS